MRVALIAPPFIPVPPPRYGGTELFLAQLANGLCRAGHEPVLFTNGESTVQCETRWLYPHMQWPVQDELQASLADLNHTSWAVREASRDCDLLHLHNAPGLAVSRLSDLPVVYTLHHPLVPELSDYYQSFPDVSFVAISHDQASRKPMPRLSVVHHCIDLQHYRHGTEKREFLVFLGRIAPIKGVHHAVEVARRTGIPLKIAGEVQPVFRDYWETSIRPHVDGKLIEYVGEADLKLKNELLGKARALLFPIEWEEPFGLVMLEALACGAPVLAFARGSVPEIVKPGVAGALCRDLDEMVRQAAAIEASPEECRAYVAREFSPERMVESYVAIYEAALHTGRSQKAPLELRRVATGEEPQVTELAA